MHFLNAILLLFSLHVYGRELIGTIHAQTVQKISESDREEFLKFTFQSWAEEEWVSDYYRIQDAFNWDSVLNDKAETLARIVQSHGDPEEFEKELKGTTTDIRELLYGWGIAMNEWNDFKFECTEDDVQHCFFIKLVSIYKMKVGMYMLDNDPDMNSGTMITFVNQDLESKDIAPLIGGCLIAQNEHREQLDFYYVWVHKTYRRNGVLRRMLEKAKQIANGLDLFADPFLHSKYVEVYERLGFQRDPEQDAFVGQDTLVRVGMIMKTKSNLEDNRRYL